MEQITVNMPEHTEELLSPQTTTLLLDDSIITTQLVHKPSSLYRFTKRCIDIVLSALGILVLLPVFLIIAICIKLDDGGDIFHFREIIGQHGRRFFALKFRTMIPYADEYLMKHPELLRKYQQNMKLSNDPRITRVGRLLRKTSLDELPQLFNVLIGQMSLVGPRIIHPSELPRYRQWGKKRLSVKPGITGLWQVSKRDHTCYEERILLDMRYIDNRSLFTDIAILIKTLKVFIVHTGI
jgi:lipopolysaccharide/colanic/teichoic acid biosynthesis glycosyltransferase